MAKEERERAVSRWDPFGELDLLERWSPLRDFPGPGSLLRRWFDERLRPTGVGFYPAMDVTETEQQYAVTLELPGTKREDVTVEMQEGVLTIRGEKRSEREEKKEHRRWVERSYGSFARSFSLPSNADADRIEASFKDGVLTVVIPKSAEAKPRQVSVK